MMLPSIHLNGTAHQELLRQALDACDAMRSAMEALSRMTPNARDYYPQGPIAIETALFEHGARQEPVRKSLKDLEAYTLCLSEMSPKPKH
jgi:hypothetical protein